MSPAAIALTDKLERDWDRELFGPKGLATLLGWESQWTFLSKGSRAGYPDRTCCRDRVIFAELKRELTGRKSEDYHRQPTPLQVAWLDRLAKAGAEVYVWRPSDLDEIALILSKRWQYELIDRDTVPYGRLRQHERATSITSKDLWTPRSMWIPGFGRADTQQLGMEAA